MSIKDHKKSNFPKNDIEENYSLIKTYSELDAQTLYKILINNPHLVYSTDDKKESILSYSIKNHNISVSNLILTSPVLDLDYQDANGNSYLHLAILFKQEEIVKLLIEKGININKKNKEGNTALHLAYLKNDKNIINILEENGIDTNILNNNNKLAEEMNNNFKQNNFNYRANVNLSNKEVNKNQIKSDKNNCTNNNNNMNLKSRNNTIINSYKFKPKNNSIHKQNTNVNNRTNHSIHSINVGITSNIRKSDTMKKNTNIYDNDQFDACEENLSLDGYKNGISKYNKKYPEIEKKIKNDFDLLKKCDEDKLINGYIKEQKNKSLCNEQNLGNFEEKENLSTDENKINKNTNEIKKKINSNLNTNRTSPKIPKKTKNKKLVRNKNRNSNKNTCLGNYVGMNNNNNNNMFMSIDQSVQSEQKKIKNISERMTINKIDNSASARNIHKTRLNNIIPNNDNFKDFNENHIMNKNQNNKKPNINVQNKNKDKSITTSKHYIKKNNIINSSDTNKEKKMKINSANLCSSSINQNNIKANSKQKNTLLVEFLSQINLIKYFYNMDSNGFDDINILIEEAKKGALIKDQELKEVGIYIPGDRAKILIRLKEKANVFRFAVPKGVYHICQNLDKIDDDKYILELNKWLQTLKVEEYLMNFIKSGYHSLELLLMQMVTESPVTQEILRDEIGINIIGHRSRILNKLKEDGNNLNNKLKTSTLIVNNKGNDKNCECFIF